MIWPCLPFQFHGKHIFYALSISRAHMSGWRKLPDFCMICCNSRNPSSSREKRVVGKQSFAGWEQGHLGHLGQSSKEETNVIKGRLKCELEIYNRCHFQPVIINTLSDLSYASHVVRYCQGWMFMVMEKNMPLADGTSNWWASFNAPFLHRHHL